MTIYIKKPKTNACHFCGKVYSASADEIFEKGVLFDVEDTLVGNSWWNYITACPKCLKKQGEKQKKKIDEMLAEVEANKTKRKCPRYYPPKRIYCKVCPNCGEHAEEDKQESCYECGEELYKKIEDPRQIKKRQKLYGKTAG